MIVIIHFYKINALTPRIRWNCDFRKSGNPLRKFLPAIQRINIDPNGSILPDPAHRKLVGEWCG